MAKDVELVHDLPPAAKSTAYLRNQNFVANNADLAHIGEAASRFNLGLKPVEAQSRVELDAALRALPKDRPGAIVVQPTPLFSNVVVLKGTKPADLPVVLVEKYELMLNLKTAKALGISISHEMLLRADEMIE